MPWCRRAHKRDEGREGGREGFADVHVSGCLTCSATPQATPLGYSHGGNSTRGNTPWALQGKQGTRVQRRDGEGVGGGEESGNLNNHAFPERRMLGNFK